MSQIDTSTPRLRSIRLARAMHGCALALGCAVCSACLPSAFDDIRRTIDTRADASVGERDAARPGPAPSLSDAAWPAPGSDASTEPGARPVSDAATEAGPSGSAAQPSDAEAEEDSGSEPPPEPPPPTFCTFQTATFCKDFEDGELSEGFGWIENIGEEPKAVPALIPRDMDNRYCYRASLLGTGEQESTRLIRVFPVDSLEVYVEFDFRPMLALGPNQRMRWLKVQQETADTKYPGVALNARSDGAFLSIENQTPAYTSEEFILPDPPSTWSRIGLRVTFGEHGSVLVTYDGLPVLELPDVRVQSADVVSMYVAFGLYTDGAAASEALYDDLKIDARR